MKAMVLDENRNFHWCSVPDPVAKQGDVLIEVHAAALNRADLLQRAGKYPPPPGWPEWLGLEVAGVVAKAEGGSRWKKGDRVCALLGGGGYAERVAAPESMMLPIPRGLTWAEAAALPEVFATAYLNLCLEAGLKAGDTVLIQAGASGLGMAAIQLARTLGARVLTTVGSEAKADAVRKLGADIVIDRRTGDLGRILDAHPVDIVMDCVGGNELGHHLDKLAPGGRWILIATLGGEETVVHLRPLLTRGLRLIGSTLRSRSNDTKGRILRELENLLWPKFESGDVRSCVYRTLPVAEAAAAHAILERNENIGKVVLQIRASA